MFTFTLNASEDKRVAAFYDNVLFSKATGPEEILHVEQLHPQNLRGHREVLKPLITPNTFHTNSKVVEVIRDVLPAFVTTSGVTISGSGAIRSNSSSCSVHELLHSVGFNRSVWFDDSQEHL